MNHQNECSKNMYKEPRKKNKNPEAKSSLKGKLEIVK